MMKPKKVWKIPTAKEYEANRMVIKTPAQRERIRKAFLVLMRRLWPTFERNRILYYGRYKNRGPCNTCAFATKTWSRRGFIATTHGLMWSIRNRKPFMCHMNQPGYKKNEFDPDRAMICMSFALVSHTKQAKDIANRAHEILTKELGHE